MVDISKLNIATMLGEDADAASAAAHYVQKTHGYKIKELKLEDNKFYIMFEDATLRVEDTMQNCCEARWITCDDKLEDFIGAEFRGIQERDIGKEDGEHDYHHDVVFVAILTSRGDITLTTHNEHNGYYGGFGLELFLEPL